MKSLSRKPISCGDFAQHAFGIAIRGGRVDEPSASVQQRLYDGIGLAPRRFVIVIENISRAKANSGNAFVAAGNCTGEKRYVGLSNSFGQCQQSACECGKVVGGLLLIIAISAFLRRVFSL